MLLDFENTFLKRHDSSHSESKFQITSGVRKPKPNKDK
jgi:hypothetical protein